MDGRASFFDYFTYYLKIDIENSPLASMTVVLGINESEDQTCRRKLPLVKAVANLWRCLGRRSCDQRAPARHADGRR